MSKLNPIRLFKKLNKMTHMDHSERVKHWNQFAGKIKGFVSEHLRAEGPVRVLDLGCGCPYWASVTFKSWGWDVTGVDVEDVRPRCSYLGLARSFGVPFALKRFVKDRLVYPRMYAELTRSLGVNVNHKEIDIRRIDGRRLPFDDDTFGSGPFPRCVGARGRRACPAGRCAQSAEAGWAHNPNDSPDPEYQRRTHELLG